MKVTGLALVPPPSAADLPKVTPELLASVLARYSRSTEGIAAILAKVDVANPDASIDRILKFVDYGHASIGGLTGGLAVALDGVSMWLAYKLFEIAQMADGQESSTRYITMDPANIPSAGELGIPDDLAPRWRDDPRAGLRGLQLPSTRGWTPSPSPSRSACALPKDAKPAVIARIRKNYALDRARYFIPFATRTNVGLVQTSRMWALTVKQLDSLPNPEARTAAALIRDELLKQSPRLMRHSFAEKSFEEQARQELAASLEMGLARLSAAAACRPGLGAGRPGGAALVRAGAARAGGAPAQGEPLRPAGPGDPPDAGHLRLEQHGPRRAARPEPAPDGQPVHAAHPGRILPSPGDPHAGHAALLNDQMELTRELMARGSPAYVYSLLLGAQTPFEHGTHADKFIYEAELRTGMGAHFRYAEHLSAALRAFLEQVPEAREWVVEGTAEPE